MRRTPLRTNPQRVAAWQRRSRRQLPAMSAKRRAQVPVRRAVTEQVRERDGGCVGRELVPEVACWHPVGVPLDVDEVRPRGTGGSALDPENAQTLCRAHHDWRHQNPNEAVDRGLERHSWD